MIRYGELFLKSERVMQRFIAQLCDNIRLALAAEGIHHAITTTRGRIFIDGEDPDGIARIVQRTFGIVDVSVCLRTEPTIAAIAESAALVAPRHLSAGMTFAVRARRENVPGFSSQELAAVTGARVRAVVPEASVDLDQPEYELFVEARDTMGLVCEQRLTAPGGLPYATQGRVLALLSGGIDSPVASWQMMRRGCAVSHLHVHAGPWGGADTKGVAIEHHRILSTWCSGFSIPLHLVDATPFYEAITERIEPRYRCVLCKRFMLRLGELFATENQAIALVTGENLGQVASQTLVNLAAISGSVQIPILRPLITYDKQDIITIARSIGTYAAIHGDLKCRAVPRYPATAALADAVHREEEKIRVPDLLTAVRAHTRVLHALNGKIREE
ncbi:MAG: tRNA 4-thiouridine(8) synthase ThiI [Methanomicrobiales archaeon]|nr:tRNA 4-thiouridine(8) synthase ThiI [Methanomicrobiales archaeon]